MSKRPTLSLVISLSLLFCIGADTTTCNPPPQNNGNGAVIAAGVIVGVGATAVILVSVNHAHHTLKGCVFSSPEGLKLRTDDLRNYTLAGSTTNLAVGNKVRLHGDRQKKEKDAAEQVFLVKELKKSYGPCDVLAASVSSPGVPAKPAPPTPAATRTQP